MTLRDYPKWYAYSRATKPLGQVRSGAKFDVCERPALVPGVKTPLISPLPGPSNFSKAPYSGELVKFSSRLDFKRSLLSGILYSAYFLKFKPSDPSMKILDCVPLIHEKSVLPWVLGDFFSYLIPTNGPLGPV